MENYLVRAFIVWILIAACEVIHGIARTRFLAPRLGDLRARQLSVFTGSGIILLITYVTLSWIGTQQANEALQVGFLWVSCMLIFEFALGRYVFKLSWKWLLNDFNLFKGRLLLLGMIFLFLAPWLVQELKS